MAGLRPGALRWGMKVELGRLRRPATVRRHRTHNAAPVGARGYVIARLAGCGMQSASRVPIDPSRQQQQLPAGHLTAASVACCFRLRMAPDAAAKSAMDGHTTASLCVVCVHTRWSPGDCDSTVPSSVWRVVSVLFVPTLRRSLRARTRRLVRIKCRRNWRRLAVPVFVPAAPSNAVQLTLLFSGRRFFCAVPSSSTRHVYNTMQYNTKST